MSLSLSQSDSNASSRGDPAPDLVSVPSLPSFRIEVPPHDTRANKVLSPPIVLSVRTCDVLSLGVSLASDGAGADPASRTESDPMSDVSLFAEIHHQPSAAEDASNTGCCRLRRRHRRGKSKTTTTTKMTMSNGPRGGFTGGMNKSGHERSGQVRRGGHGGDRIFFTVDNLRVQRRGRYYLDFWLWSHPLGMALAHVRSAEFEVFPCRWRKLRIPRMVLDDEQKYILEKLGY